MKRITLVIAALSTTGCLETPRLPENVTLTQDRKYVEKVVFHHPTSRSADSVFSQLKLCTAEHISNEGVQLRDSSGSFVGATGRYYEINKSKTTQGAATVQMVDDNAKSVIAKGIVPYAGTDFLSLPHYLKFTARMSVQPGQIGMSVSQISIAQESTGSMSNPGFFPLGTWAGSGAGVAYSALEHLSEEIFSCVNSNP